MSFQKIELELYDLANLPDRIRKERELKRWRDIMAQQRYEQDDLPGYLDAEAKARESDIPEEAIQRRRKALAMRWFGYYKKATDPNKRFDILRQYNNIATMRQR
jgi:hypothetical protein